MFSVLLTDYKFLLIFSKKQLFDYWFFSMSLISLHIFIIFFLLAFGFIFMFFALDSQGRNFDYWFQIFCLLECMFLFQQIHPHLCLSCIPHILICCIFSFIPFYVFSVPFKLPFSYPWIIEVCCVIANV